MIALASGVLLLGVGATSAALLLRPRGVVALALSVGVLAFGELVAISHALSLVDAYERRWFLVALAAIAVVAAAAVVVTRPATPWRGRRDVLRRLARDPVAATLSVVVMLEGCYLAALALFTPPSENDVLTYHLTRAVLWIQQGSLAPIPDLTDWRINDFPRNAELVMGWTMMLSDSVRWVGLVQLVALGASVLAIYGIATRIGFARRAAAFGALLYPTLPVVALQAPNPKNDLIVAALAAVTVFFVLGRSRGEIVLAAIAGALLIGTKVTALFVLPVILAVALLAHGRGRRGVLLATGIALAVVGAAWYVVDLRRGMHVTGGVLHGSEDESVKFLARLTRYAVETVELPGAWGWNFLAYVVAAGVVAVAGVVRGARRDLLVAACLTALTPLVLPLERVLHSVYWHGWELVRYDSATGLGVIRDPTVASGVQSWYGPVGLGACLAALALVGRAALAGRRPWIPLALALAPVVGLVGSAAAVGYHSYSGRYVMGGVALSAATWGLLRPKASVAWALVAVSATTVLLALLSSTEKPTGIGLLEGTDQPSIWTLSREWSQNAKPELAPITRYVDDHAKPGSTIAVARDPLVYPFIYVGYPRIDHRLVYADTLAEATRTEADWAVLGETPRCASGWRLAVESGPWALFQRDTDALCADG